ncbi:MAG: hypothetical protein HZB76_07015 [Chlamydiae bacterium]|nr:hypothetical protein [Chlamydiota bacterium]
MRLTGYYRYLELKDALDQAKTAGREKIEAETYFQNAYLECSASDDKKEAVLESSKLDNALSKLQYSYIFNHLNVWSTNITLDQFKQVAIIYEAKLLAVRKTERVFQEEVLKMSEYGVPYSELLTLDDPEFDNPENVRRARERRAWEEQWDLKSAKAANLHSYYHPKVSYSRLMVSLIDAAEDYNIANAAYCATTAGKEEIEASTYFQNAYLECSASDDEKEAALKSSQLDGALSKLRYSYIFKHLNVQGKNITLDQFKQVAIIYEAKLRAARGSDEFIKEHRAAKEFKEVVVSALKSEYPSQYLIDGLAKEKAKNGEKLSDRVISQIEHWSQSPLPKERGLNRENQGKLVD